MANSVTNPANAESLQMLLEPGTAVFSSEEAVSLLAGLADQVTALHRSGKVHRAISAESVVFNETSSTLELLPAPEEPVLLGGPAADHAQTPPELQTPEALPVPADLQAARQLLASRGINLDPARIDLYQLGTLLVRLVGGESVSAYLRSPRTKRKISADVQPLIDGALGYELQKQFRSTADLSEAAGAVLARLRERAAKPTVAMSPQDDGAAGSISRQDTDLSVVAEATSDTSIEPPRRTDTEQSDLPFRRLAHYEIQERIGRGGMGDVFKGYERVLDRTVAIKVLPEELSRQDDFVRRFHAEASAAARLIHPNIIQIHFIGEEAGHHFFAMQYIEGESLAELLARRRKLSVEETLAIVEQALSGLAAAHRQQMVHRDIKPGNILLDRENRRALLADFGLVKSVDRDGGRMTATGVIMGTVDYIAPEQGRGQAVDSRADLYSIGVLMYQMLSGRLPFTADSPTAMIFQHVYEQPPALRSIAPEAPEELATVIDRLLAKSPDDRYQTAEAVLDHLRAFREGRPLARHDRKPAAAQRSAAKDTVIIEVPQFDDAAWPLTAAAVRAPNRWDDARERLLSLFQRHAPRFLQELQSTGQQIDGALREHERRRDQLRGLVSEAESVLSELQAQAISYREAAEAAAERAEEAQNDDAAADCRREKFDCEQMVAELEGLIAQQRDQMEQMELRLAQVSGRLEQLRSQRDILNARLKAAQARLRMAGAAPSDTQELPWGALGATAGALVLVALGSLFGFALPVPMYLLLLIFGSTTLLGLLAALAIRKVWPVVVPGALMLGIQIDMLFQLRGASAAILLVVALTGLPLAAFLHYDDCKRAIRRRFSATTTIAFGALAGLLLSLALLPFGPSINGFPTLVAMFLVLWFSIGLSVAASISFDLSPRNADPRDGIAANVQGKNLVPMLLQGIAVAAFIVFVVALLLPTSVAYPSASMILALLISQGAALAALHYIPHRVIGTPLALSLLAAGIGTAGMILGNSRLVIPNTPPSQVGGNSVRENVPSPPAQVTAPALAPLPGTIDLMKLIDPVRDSVLGDWRLENGVLVSPVIQGQGARLQIPFTPPDEYVLTVEVERQINNHTLILGLLAGGIQGMVSLDGWGSTMSGLNLDGKEANNNETTRRGTVLTRGRPNLITATVRRNGIRVTADGKVVIDWTGSPERLWVEPGWIVPNKHQLYLGTWETEYRFTRLEVTPLPGDTPVPNGPPGTVQTFSGHEDEVQDVSFSPDGRYIASVSWDGTARVWDVQTGEELRRFTSERELRTVGFSPDGTRLLAAGNLGTAYLHDLHSGRELARFNRKLATTKDGGKQISTAASPPIWTAAFSPDGRRIVIGDQSGYVAAWETDGKKLLWSEKPLKEYVYSVQFSPDGQRVLTSGRETTVYELMAANGRQARAFKDFNAWVLGAVFSPDGNSILAGGYGRALRLIDHREQNELRQFVSPQGSTYSVAFSHDGRLAAAGELDGIVRIWDVESGKQLDEFDGHEAKVWSVAFSPDDRFIISGSADRTVRLWRLSPSGEQRSASSQAGNADQPVAAPAPADDEDRTVTQPAGTQEARSPRGPSVTRKDGTVIYDLGLQEANGAAKDYSVYIPLNADKVEVGFYVGGHEDRTSPSPGYQAWLAINADVVLRWQGHLKPESGPAIYFFENELTGERVSSDKMPGEWLDVTRTTHPGENFFRYYHHQKLGQGMRVRIHLDEDASLTGTPLAGNESLLYFGYSTVAHDLSVSSDGRSALVAGGPVVYLLDLKTGDVVQEFWGHLGNVRSVALSHDGQQVATGGDDHTIRIWNAATGQELQTLEGHDWPVLTLAFSPDDRRLLSGSDSLHLWDLETGRQLREIRIPVPKKETVWTTTFFSDGRRALTGSWDGTVRVWNLETGEELKTLAGHTGRVKSVRLSSDERLAVSCATEDPVVRLWDLETGEVVRTFEGHRAGVSSVALSPDGKWLLSGGGLQHPANGSFLDIDPRHIRLWNASTGEMLEQLGSHGSSVADVAFVAAGGQAVSCGAEGTVQVWDLPSDAD